eukprot:COSAG01_NODE_3532_length_5963_cov_21.070771_11_plen_51_part_01
MCVCVCVTCAALRSGPVGGWWWWWWLLWSGLHDMQAIAAYVSFMQRQPQFA